MRGLMLPTLTVALLVLLVSGAFAGDADMGPSITIVNTEEGPVYATAEGLTLYTYAGDDGTPGKSQCLNTPRTTFPDPTAGFGQLPLPSAELHKSCVHKWPPLMANEDARVGGEWTLIERAEGGKQWAYRGRPLYTSVKDHKSGDINGLTNIGQLRGWRLASAPLKLPPGLSLVRSAKGLVLATSNNRPVYAPSAAQPQNICDGCAESFAPVAAPAVAKVSGDWSIVDAGAGRRQYAFKGQRLFVPPSGLSNAEIAEQGGWETVLYQRSAGVPSAVQTRMSLLGEIYTDRDGKTLYVFTCSTPVRDGVLCDDPGDAAAYWAALCGKPQDCATRWRPYAAASDAHDVGDWSVVEVADPMFVDARGTTYPAGTPRVRTWAYRGRPVYTYYEDQQAGDIWGHSRRWFGYSGFYALQVPGRGLMD